MDYDVVVVGAGPGGSIVASTLAKGGARVLLAEKRAEIGMPVRCGEAVGISALREFGIKGDEKFIANETSGVYLHSPSGIRVEMLNQKPNGYILERRYFDKHLAMEAARAGAEVSARTYATGLARKNDALELKLKRFDEEFTVQCRCVVGADGIEGKVGKWAGIDTRTSLDQMTSNAQFEMAGVELEPRILEFFFGSRVAPKGYAWVFPKGDDVANVGLGIRDSKETAYAHLKRFVESQENLKKGSIVGVVAGGVPVSGPIQTTVSDGVVLVGDAARQVDPLTGGGIYNAMRCGAMAGETILEAMTEGDFSKERLMKYEEKWRATIGQKLLRSQRVKEALEKLSDSDLDKIAKAMQGLDWGDIDIKDAARTVFKMPPELLSFIKSLLVKK